MAKYSGIVQGSVQHGEGLNADGTPNSRVYYHGETFETDDDHTWEELRRVGAVLLPGEAPVTAERVAALMTLQEAQTAELETARSRIAELEAMVKAQSGNKAPAPRLPE